MLEIQDTVGFHLSSRHDEVPRIVMESKSDTQILSLSPHLETRERSYPVLPRQVERNLSFRSPPRTEKTRMRRRSNFVVPVDVRECIFVI